MSKGTEKIWWCWYDPLKSKFEIQHVWHLMCVLRVYSYIPAGTVHTGKASLHYGHACVSQGGSAE